MPSARRGKRAGRRIAMATCARRLRYFESAAATFPRSDYRPAWLYWSGRARAAMGDASRGDCALSADDRRLSQHLLRPPGAEASLQKQGARSRQEPARVCAARVAARPAKTSTSRRPKRRFGMLLAARVVRARREGAGVRAREMGRFAGHHRHAGVGEQTDGGIGIGNGAVRTRARLDYVDEAGVPAVHGERRRPAAAGNPDDDLSARATGISSRNTPLSTISIRISSRRSWRRSRRSCATSSRMPGHTG